MGKMKMELGLYVSLVIILLSLELGVCDVAANSNSTTLRGMCIQRERAALLIFKATLYMSEYSTLLPSWNSSNRDCCSWESVTCHRITGHVIALNLTRGNKLIDDDDVMADTIDSSLLELKHLTYLDLSGIRFNYIEIPAYLGSLNQLQCLNLSHTYFYGVVPQNLGNLSSLRTLDISWTSDLRVDDLMWASRLLSLEHLDMSGVNLSMATHVFEVLNTIPSLLFLSLSSSGLDNTHLPHSPIYNSTLLANFQHLDLSFNYFRGEFPYFLPNMTSLTYLDLSVNLLHGPIPTSIWNLSLLTNLAIFSNNFSGFIPTSIGKLSALTNLDISSNKLSGEIPTCLGELTNLESIDISHNSFETTLSEAHFAGLSNLLELGAASNKMIGFSVESDWMPPFQLKSLFLQSSEMGGQFPQWLQTQKALERLHLSNCSIMGTFPAWLQSLSSLKLLNLSHNNISGPIPEFASSNMTYLDLSDNIITHLPFNIGHMIPHLRYLLLERNLIKSSIPVSLCQIKDMRVLDLARNRFSGNLPNCNWSSFYNLEVASFSSNELTGAIPKSIGRSSFLSRLRLDGNSFTGQLPSTLKNCNRLELLDVGGNNLSGKIPQWIGKHLLQLRFLVLRDNDFSGTIPIQMCQLSELQVLDIANNNLTGNVPHCFAFFSGMMLNHDQVGVCFFPYVSTVSQISQGLSQVIKGVELEYTTNFLYVVNMDLSSNHLVGEIPWELIKLSGLIGLNLSHNHLKGQIPAHIGDMKSLESLDLSNNNLQGMIPCSLSSLSFLSRLNLSSNNFSGQIPSGRQLQTLDDPSIYQGNPLLCGAPLQRKCDEAQDAENHEAVDEDRADKIWFYGIINAGFATGFWAVIGVMVVKTKWRQAYFRCIEVVMAKMLGY